MKFFLILLLCICAKVNFAHTYFFAFAEVEYNVMQEKLEGTLIFTSHDLEEELLKKGIITSKFDKLAHDSLSISKIGNELFKHFNFSQNDVQINLKALGFSLTKNGLIEIYFESEKVKVADFFDVEFSNLMQDNPKQQNKITFIKNKEKQTFVFLNGELKRKINLN